MYVLERTELYIYVAEVIDVIQLSLQLFGNIYIQVNVWLKGWRLKQTISLDRKLLLHQQSQLFLTIEPDKRAGVLS